MSVAAIIQNILGSAPAELVSYFEQGQFPVNPSTNIRCLPLQEAAEYTKAVHQMAIIGKPMGLFVLDDAEDSNPYCYISHGPCAGAVLHLSHDDSSTIDFRSLRSFLAAIRSLPDTAWIDELKPERPLFFDTSAEIERMLNDSCEDLDVFSAVYLPVTHSLPEPLKEKLAAHDNFFVREALANWLLSFGTHADADLTGRLASDKHPQVASLATKALQHIRPS